MKILPASDRHSKHEEATNATITVLILIISIVAIGTAGYMAIEGWSMLDSLYMVVITLATVGFREVNPLSPAGQIFTMLLIVFGVGILYYVLKLISESILVAKLEETLTDKRIYDKAGKLTDHYIVIGWGRVGREVVSEFLRSQSPPVIIDHNPEKVNRARQEGILAIIGSGSDEKVLMEAGVVSAKGIIIATGNDGENLLAVITARSLNPNLFIVARGSDEVIAQKLIRVGANRVVVPHRIGGSRMAMMALKPQVADFVDEIVSSENGQFQIEDVRIGRESAIAGKDVANLLSKHRTGVAILAIHKSNDRVLVNPTHDTVIEVGDRLILLGTSGSLEQVHKSL